MAKRKSNAGRPTIMTPLTIQKLDEAFMLGCTDAEACFYADISMSTLYNYQGEHPEFVDKKERFKQNPIFKARKSVIDSLDEDPDLAMKFLERKLRREFGPQQNINLSGNVGIARGIDDMADDEIDKELEELG